MVTGDFDLHIRTSKDAEAWLKILINLDQGQLAELIREIILTKCEEQLFLIWL